MVTGSNTHDICVPATGTSYTRHNFSSVVSNKELILRLNPVSCDTDAGIFKFEHRSENVCVTLEVSKGAKIRNRYNQVPHLTQDTNGKVTNSRLDTTNDS